MLSVLALFASSSAVALADLSSDCVYFGNSLRVAEKQCGVGAGAVNFSNAIACLSTHETVFGQVAHDCVAAAQSHYAAGSTLRGYTADRELMQAAIYLGLAATADEYLGRRDLAVSQFKSVIALSSGVRSDPNAGDLASPAAKELAWANSVLQALTAPR